MIMPFRRSFVLTPPAVPLFVIAVALAVLAVLGRITPIPVITPNAFSVLLIGFVILAVGNLFRGV
jgi:hypothetical protein